jgi:hypothetical protein
VNILNKNPLFTGITVRGLGSCASQWSRQRHMMKKLDKKRKRDILEMNFQHEPKMFENR